MAIEAYMYFKEYAGNAYLPAESQVQLAGGAPNIASVVAPFLEAQKNTALFEVEDYSFDIEQVLNIGSQSSGSGAGKVTFNPFSITRKIDIASTVFFQKACSGTPFQQVGLGMRKSAGGDAAGAMYLVFTFKLVAVKTIGWAHDDEAPKETVTFEYGGLTIQYCQQKADGSLMPPKPGGWNRVKNISDTHPETVIN
jgi:type VI secretion system secreted protein Hcp